MMFLPALNAHQPRNVTLNGSIPCDSLPCCTIHIQPRAPRTSKLCHQPRSESLCILEWLLWGGNVSIKSGQRKEPAGGALEKTWWASLHHPPQPALTVGLSKQGHYMEIFKMEKKPGEVHFQRFKGNISVKVLYLLGPSYLKVLTPVGK